MKNKLFYFVLILFLGTTTQAQDLKKVNFDKHYQKKNKGKSKVEIHEVKELLHIMIAITELGLANDDMVDQSTAYYKDVLSHFEPFKKEPIITTFDSLIQASPLNYVFLTGNAISYDFKGNKLVKNKNYIFPAQSVSSHTRITENLITIYKDEIETFAKKSDFRGFYKKAKPHYDKVIADYTTYANIKQQWTWLEDNFDTKIDNYVLMCSPLIGGLNYTTTYEDNGFKQILLVVPAIYKYKKLSEVENTIENTRSIFTEIDHNYVDSPTLQYEQQINEALKDREVWVNTKQAGTDYYPTARRVFDEYMTWVVYLLYVMDTFKDNQAALDYTYKDVNSTMLKRGFWKIKEFNDQVIALRKAHPNQKVQDMYPALIEWCKTQ